MLILVRKQWKIKRSYYKWELKHFFEEKKVGKDNIVSATVHMDESISHIHLSFVLINEDGSLLAKKKINRDFLREVQYEFSERLKNEGFNIF